MRLKVILLYSVHLRHALGMNIQLTSRLCIQICSGFGQQALESMKQESYLQ